MKDFKPAENVNQKDRLRKAVDEQIEELRAKLNGLIHMAEPKVQKDLTDAMACLQRARKNNDWQD